MKRLVPVLGLILMTQVLSAQEKKPWNVDRLCGRADYVTRIPDRKHPDSYSEKRSKLKTIELQLFEASDGVPCCEALKNVGTTTTGRSGQFELKPDHAGSYWLVAGWNGNDSKIRVIYQPQPKSTTVCSDQGIQIQDDGDASWWTTITVD